jgi:hypothetical protein
MGIGDWGIGDWGLGIGPNPQSPIPNPQSPIFMPIKYKKKIKEKNNSKIKNILFYNSMNNKFRYFY